MQFRSIRGAILYVAHPGAVFQIVVDSGEPVPGDAAVIGAKQALRRRARIPSIRLVRMAGREPEGVINCAAFLSLRRLGECRWPGCFLPSTAEISGTSAAAAAGIHVRHLGPTIS